MHGKDTFFKKVLQSGYSNSVHKRLVVELTKLEHTESEPLEETTEKKFSLPKDLVELRDNLNTMYSELRLIHAELPKQINASARCDMVLKIVEDFKTIDAGYEIIKFYEATGKRPESSEPVTDAVYTLKRILDSVKQIPVNISKTKSKLAKETDPERITMLSNKIAAWENEFNTIEEIIKLKGDVVIHDGEKAS